MKAMSNFKAKFADETVKDGEYRDVLIEEHEGNPAIEALPAILSKQDVLERIGYFPNFKKEALTHPSEVRVQIVRGLERIFVPLHRHYTLESEISTLLRLSYIDRNNFANKTYWNHLSEKVDRLKERLVATKAGQMRYHPGGFKGSFFLCGMSGLGKTIALSRILALYPQVIFHSQYRGQAFPFTQVVWLKLDCPHNSSIRGLCDKFFIEVDRVIGNTTFAEDYGGRTGPQMIPDVGRIAGLFNIGLIVIDEIQNLSLVKSSGAKQMLAFFTELINTSGCGVLMVGTERAQEVLEQEFWQVRRNITSRPFHWEPFARTESDHLIWEKFLESFWDYQYTVHKAELTPEIKRCFHHETVGIPDLVVKLFIGVQQQAIENETEKITLDLIVEVANTIFAPAQATLAAFRNDKPGAREELNKYIQEMNGRQPSRGPGEKSASQTRTLPDPPNADKPKQLGRVSSKSQKKKARQTTGLPLAVEQAGEEDVSTYSALVAGGYVAPKGEFQDT